MSGAQLFGRGEPAAGSTFSVARALPGSSPDALLNKILWDYLKGPGRDG